MTRGTLLPARDDCREETVKRTYGRASAYRKGGSSVSNTARDEKKLGW